MCVIRPISHETRMILVNKQNSEKSRKSGRLCRNIKFENKIVRIVVEQFGSIYFNMNYVVIKILNHIHNSL